MEASFGELLVGVLADDSFVLERTGGKAAVFVNSLQVVQFAIRPVSRLPAAFPTVKLFYGFGKDLERHGFLDDFVAEPELRIQRLRSFLAGQLLIFRPTRKGQYFNIADVCLVASPVAHRADINYVPVPVFSLQLHQLSFSELMARLRTGQPAGQVRHFSTEPADAPPYVIWREGALTTQSWQVIGRFERQQFDQNGGLQLSGTDALRITGFQESWESGVFEVPGDLSLLFVSEETHSAIQQALEQAPAYQATAEPTAAREEVAPAEVARVEVEVEVALPRTPEQLFLTRLQETAARASLLYTASDLVNFHTALKTSNLVILAGLSGTGKSALPRIYAEALGLPREQVAIIPVRPAWTDDADLLGSVDGTQLVYRTGDSGLLPMLVQAASHPDRLYLICLDEMNLARVEHYFSQLLSVLEQPLAQRRLRLYPDELAPMLFNRAEYPPTIDLGDNLLFVGTVNLDESTYHLSDKVLDRANVINLELRPFRDLLTLTMPSSEASDARTTVTADLYRSFAADQRQLGLSERELELLQQVHELLHRASQTQGIGYRVVRQIGAYLANLPENAALSHADALDRQLLQRVLTKLRGPENKLLGIIGSAGAGDSNPLLQLLDAFQDISPFTRCRQALIYKSKDLADDGYTV